MLAKLTRFGRIGGFRVPVNSILILYLCMGTIVRPNIVWVLAVAYFWRAKVEDLTALLQSLQRSNNGGDHSSPSLSQKQSSLGGESNVSPFGSIPGGSTKI